MVLKPRCHKRAKGLWSCAADVFDKTWSKSERKGKICFEINQWHHCRQTCHVGRTHMKFYITGTKIRFSIVDDSPWTLIFCVQKDLFYIIIKTKIFPLYKRIFPPKPWNLARGLQGVKAFSPSRTSLLDHASVPTYCACASAPTSRSLSGTVTPKSQIFTSSQSPWTNTNKLLFKMLLTMGVRRGEGWLWPPWILKVDIFLLKTS